MQRDRGIAPFVRLARRPAALVLRPVVALIAVDAVDAFIALEAIGPVVALVEVHIAALVAPAPFAGVIRLRWHRCRLAVRLHGLLRRSWQAGRRAC